MWKLARRGERACPALGREAAPKPDDSICLEKRGDCSGAAAQPNAGQASSPQKVSAQLGNNPASPVTTQTPCGSGLARECGGSVPNQPAGTPPSRASPLPHRVVAVFQISRNKRAIRVRPRLMLEPGSDPASANPAVNSSDRACPRWGAKQAPKPKDSICLEKRGDGSGAAAQPNAGPDRSPQQVSAQLGNNPASPVTTQNPCGSGLARECGGSVPNQPAGTQPSRASPLPHGVVAVFQISVRGHTAGNG